MNVQYSYAVLIKLFIFLSNRGTEQVAALIGRFEDDHYVIQDVIPARNEGADPRDTFFISHEQLANLTRKAQIKGASLVGIAHSHLDHHPANPSQADMAHCRHAVNAVYHPATRSLTWFNGMGDQKQLELSLSSLFPKFIQLQLSM